MPPCACAGSRVSSVLSLAGWVMLGSDMPILNYLKVRRPHLRLAQGWLFTTYLLLLAALAAGCAHSEKSGGGTSAFEARPAPVAPIFLNGPMALLLTNVEGFRARVVLESGTSAPGAPLAAGELLVHGGKMLFAPASKADASKKARAPESAFIWDVTTNSGYVLNEPLQGYAPLSSSRQYTNLTYRACRE